MTALKEEIRAMAVSQDLLDILACPKCKGELRLTDKRDGLVCEACKLLYLDIHRRRVRNLVGAALRFDLFS